MIDRRISNVYFLITELLFYHNRIHYYSKLENKFQNDIKMSNFNTVFSSGIIFQSVVIILFLQICLKYLFENAL